MIEGQCSRRLPAYAGVALALRHGSQPDMIVVCHEHGRERVLGYPDLVLPGIEETIDLALRLGRRTNPSIRCAGVSLNTATLQPAPAQRVLAVESERLACAVADPLRGGPALERLVEDCLACHRRRHGSTATCCRVSCSRPR